MARERMEHNSRLSRNNNNFERRGGSRERRERFSPERRATHSHREREVVHSSSVHGHRSSHKDPPSNPRSRSDEREKQSSTVKSRRPDDKLHSTRDRVSRNSPVPSSSKAKTTNTDMRHASHKNLRQHDSNGDNPQTKHRQSNKREREESFEELSRRKKRIESELIALEAQERAEEESKKKPSSRNHSNHRHHREDKTVKIKQEPVSDGEQQPARAQRSNESRSRRHRNEANGETTPDLEWGRPSGSREQNAPNKDKEKPNFGTSGKLAEDTNTYNGVVIKYNEPKEARKPKRKWRLYPFKGESCLPYIPVHRQSAYLFGRSRLIADLPIDHPSCSKQHAVLQYRVVPLKRDDGTTGRTVRPYIIDLDSSNGTYLNNKKVDPRCYVEILERDVLKFGFSSRVYVMLHEDSKNLDDVLDGN